VETIMQKLVIIANNLRSTHNIGSLLRTAEGLGIKTVYLTGYTPYPKLDHDERLPHIASKVDSQIHKTALGAEKFLEVLHVNDVFDLVSNLKADGYHICGLEQDKRSVVISKYEVPAKVALILGNEVTGIEPEILDLCDQIIELPMFGKKESFNVVQAAAMAMFYISVVKAKNT
jgi:23S rRNA (guanosine2251-2'-O)-methyltransferase